MVYHMPELLYKTIKRIRTSKNFKQYAKNINYLMNKKNKNNYKMLQKKKRTKNPKMKKHNHCTDG